VVGLAWLVLAVTPALVALSQHHLGRSLDAYRAGDCPEAIEAALDSSSVLGVRPEPWELIGYCDVRLGRERLAVAALERATERDPNSWEVHYGLSLVRGAAGLDPRAEAARALELNPRDRLTVTIASAFNTRNRELWRKHALAAPLRVPR
jgi:hypothetical protein